MVIRAATMNALVTASTVLKSSSIGRVGCGALGGRAPSLNCGAPSLYGRPISNEPKDSSQFITKHMQRMKNSSVSTSSVFSSLMRFMCICIQYLRVSTVYTNHHILSCSIEQTHSIYKKCWYSYCKEEILSFEMLYQTNMCS